MRINAKTRVEVIETTLKNLNDSNVFPEVAQKMETNINRRVQDKEYDEITSASERVKKLVGQ